MRPELRGAVLLLALGLSGPLLAAPEWSALPAEQQALIAPALQGADFNSLSEARRERLAEGARRWLAMDPEQRNQATRQFDTWQRMAPAERRAVIEQRERFRQLPRQEQQSLLERQRRFESLPGLEQDRLRTLYRQHLDEVRPLVPLTQPLEGLLPPLTTVPGLPPASSPAPSGSTAPSTGILPN